MGRTAHNPPLVVESNCNVEMLQQDAKALDDLRIITQQSSESFQAGLEVGRVQSMSLMRDIAESVILERYESIKKSKSWKNAPNKSGAMVADFDEFCELYLGKSQRRIQELISNRNLIGQEIYDRAVELGLRQVDYNAIKALPASKQELIRQAVEEASSREDVLNVLQDVMVKNQAEVNELNQALQEEKSKREEAVETAEARLQVISQKSEEVSKLQEKIAKKIKVKDVDLSDVLEVSGDGNKQAMMGLGLLLAAHESVIKYVPKNPDDEDEVNMILEARERFSRHLRAQLDNLRDEFDRLEHTFSQGLALFSSDPSTDA